MCPRSHFRLYKVLSLLTIHICAICKNLALGLFVDSIANDMLNSRQNLWGLPFNCAHCLHVSNITIQLCVFQKTRRTVWIPFPSPFVFIILANCQKMAEGRVIFPVVILKCWLVKFQQLCNLGIFFFSVLCFLVY